MGELLLAVAAFALLFGLFDAVWLNTQVKRLYEPVLGPIMARPYRMGAAAVFYALYVAGVALFVMRPQLGDWQGAGMMGAAFGLVAYATYDLTNLVTVRVWTVRLAVIDMLWGTAATGVASALAVAVAAWVGG
ncbi:DUF2177 family protein [Sandaracinobacteroides saxicola]|uniref:DUF2177 family protein n=1 Tax=Sandaracinobacteroides saxicola TaxID=2759707 RepID=A0A7G5ILL2_9SPHN|nr:DUF2177 family protein [Sandaracinobacteroides saxicola]QMW24254.1 DUF2177 family protein [Sandaracinobacteroides saxicola]